MTSNQIAVQASSGFVTSPKLAPFAYRRDASLTPPTPPTPLAPPAPPVSPAPPAPSASLPPPHYPLHPLHLRGIKRARYVNETRPTRDQQRSSRFDTANIRNPRTCTSLFVASTAGIIEHHLIVVYARLCVHSYHIGREASPPPAQDSP